MGLLNGIIMFTQKENLTSFDKIRKARTKRNAVYLNNDHGMLQNGLYLLQRFDFILKRFD